jgi:hypothetical protein
MSEMRRVAKALVETRTERFESLHGRDESKARLARALGRVGDHAATLAEYTWSEVDGRAVLDVRFAPPPRIPRLLKLLSGAMAGLVAASAWAIAMQDGALRFLLPLFTAFAILAVPMVALGLGSQRAADESRIARAIRTALRDEEERMPKQQAWEDED